MNETISTKYQLVPETIEERSLNPNDRKYFQEIYEFMRIKKIENNQMRNNKYDRKIDRSKRTLRSPSNLDEKVLLLTICRFLIEIIFTIYKRAKLNNNTYLYWVEEDGQFLR